MNQKALRKTRISVSPVRMSCKQLRIFEPALLVLILVVVISACETNTYTWKEEVLLHDGGKIIAERTVVRGGGSEIGQGPTIKEHSLKFAMPGTNEMIYWEDSFTADIGSASFSLMQLEIRGGAAYLVASPMGSLSYKKWGNPNPPYVVFKYQGKTWQRIRLEELPAEFTVPNLIFSSPDTEARKAGQGIVSAAAIRNLYDGYKQPEYKAILRTPVDRWKSRPQNIGPKAPNPVTATGTIENKE